MVQFGTKSIQQIISAHLISSQYYEGHKDIANTTSILDEILIHKWDKMCINYLNLSNKSKHHEILLNSRKLISYF